MHVDVPIILVVIGTFVVLLALAYLIRQLVVSRHRGSFEASFRRRAIMGGESWQPGLAFYGSDRLRWFRAFSLRISPEESIRRADIMDLTRSDVQPSVDGIETYVLLTLHLADGTRRSMLVPRAAASGVLSWIESAPAASGMLRGTD